MARRMQVALPWAFALTLALAGCAGGTGQDEQATAPQPPVPPAAAGASLDGFIGFAAGLAVQRDDSALPFELGGFNPPGNGPEDLGATATPNDAPPGAA